MGGGGEWTPQDRTVTLALTLYEAGLCSECGQPMSICRDPGNDFELVEDTCGAKAVIDSEMGTRQKSGADPEPGQVVSARLDDTPSVAVPPWAQG